MRVDYLSEYSRWLESDAVDEATKQELLKIKGDQKEIESRFGSALTFGTAGLRGILGAGLNRMNVYTVRQATQGLAALISSLGEDACRRGVAIAHDCRILSPEFAREAARVLAASGVNAYVFDELRPTPELSFAVRSLHCIAGINITASHNPKEYNGYKAYWEDGAQLPPEHAAKVLEEIRRTDIFDGVHEISLKEAEEKDLVRFIGKEIDEQFLAKVLEQSVAPDAVREEGKKLKIVYTPFHGAGYRLVPEALRRLGFEKVLPVAEQMVPDGSFPTVKSPNPEYKEGFKLAIALAQKEGSDLIIGTDPDADRTGVVVKTDGGYEALTGNQLGALLTDFVIRARENAGTMPKNPAVVTTIVSTRLTFEICRRHGVKVFEVLTGFKFIGEKIKEFEESGSHSFLFGFEESYGYLAGTYARDKDAVVASMLTAEMAAWYRRQGMTLYDALAALYAEYGFYAEKTTSLEMQGFDAPRKMQQAMRALRAEAPSQIGDTAVLACRDYLKGERTELKTGKKTATGLPESDVLFYELSDGSNIIARPSGTEPKIKLYVLVKAGNREDADALTDKYSNAFEKMVLAE